MMHISSEQLFLSMARTCCTMKKLSALSGVSVQTLRNIKAGKAIFPETAGKIARALGVDVADLLESKAKESNPCDKDFSIFGSSLWNTT